MAERIENFEVPPPKIGQSAHEELEQLLESLHRGGILRFANDLVSAKAGVAEVLVSGLQKQGTMNALQNLSILAMALSQISPNQFYKVVFALKDACVAVGRAEPDEEHDEAPGLTGAYKLLHDDELWQALNPVIDALKRFAAGLEREVENPISAFSGKKGDI